MDPILHLACAVSRNTLGSQTYAHTYTQNKNKQILNCPFQKKQKNTWRHDVTHYECLDKWSPSSNYDINFLLSLAYRYTLKAFIDLIQILHQTSNPILSGLLIQKKLCAYKCYTWNLLETVLNFSTGWYVISISTITNLKAPMTWPL